MRKNVMELAENTCAGIIIGVVTSIVLLLLGAIENYGVYGTSPIWVLLVAPFIGLTFAGPNMDRGTRTMLIAGCFGAVIMIASFSEECGHEGCVDTASFLDSFLSIYGLFLVGVVMRLLIRGAHTLLVRFSTTQA